MRSMVLASLLMVVVLQSPAFAQSAASHTGQAGGGSAADAVASLPCHLLEGQNGLSGDQIAQFAQQHGITPDQARQIIDQCGQRQANAGSGSAGAAATSSPGTGQGGAMGQGMMDHSNSQTMPPGGMGTGGMMSQGATPGTGTTPDQPSSGSARCAMMKQAAQQMTEEQMEQMAQQHGMSKAQFRDMLQRCQ